MQAYKFEEPAHLRAARALVFVAGLADLLSTVYLAGGVVVHPGSISVAQNFALAWHVVHVFSWLAALVVGSDSLSPWFALLTFAIYSGAFLLDGAAFAIRWFFVPTATLFDAIAFWVGIALWAIDAFVVVIGFAIMVFVIRQRYRIFRYARSWAETEVKYQKLWIESRWGYWFRTTALPVLRFADVIFTFALAVVFVLGLNRSPSFSRILLLEVPHLFLWIWMRAMSGTAIVEPPDGMIRADWLWAAILGATVSSAMGATALALRSIYIFFEPDIDPLSLVANVLRAFGWIQFGLGVVLLLIHLAYLGVLASFFGHIAAVGEEPGDSREDVFLERRTRWWDSIRKGFRSY